jgi:hypothetical protein
MLFFTPEMILNPSLMYQIFWGLIIRKAFFDLLCCLLSGRIGADIEMYNPSLFMSQYH